MAHVTSQDFEVRACHAPEPQRSRSAGSGDRSRKLTTGLLPNPSLHRALSRTRRATSAAVAHLPLLHRPRHHQRRPIVRRVRSAEQRNPAPLDRCPLVREGPAWNSEGRYLVWSDIPNDRQMRWLEDDGHVSVFRRPSNNSNGNSFDFQGRQLSCEHLTRRVVRYELDGSVTVLADNHEGKRLNSPNDVVPHPDGSYWFTDPPYGGRPVRGRARRRGWPEQRGRTA